MEIVGLCEDCGLQTSVIASGCCPRAAAVASNEPRQPLRCEALIAETRCLISDISCRNGPAACGEVEGVEGVEVVIGEKRQRRRDRGAGRVASVGVPKPPRRITPPPA